MYFTTLQKIILLLPPPYGEIVPAEERQLSFFDDAYADLSNLAVQIGLSDYDKSQLMPKLKPCKLCTTGCRRTGCVFCMFGAHLEKGETRFQRLKHTHPKLYNYCIYGGAYDSDGIWKPDKNGLGMKHVFDELNKIYGENFIRYE